MDPYKSEVDYGILFLVKDLRRSEGLGVHVTRSERGGATSTLVAALLPAVVVLTGLVVDGAAQARAQHRVTGIAQGAVRAGGDSLAGARVGSGQTHGDPVLTARTFLAQQDVEGAVSLDDGALRVEITDTVPTVFLGLIGIDTLPVRGEAAAELTIR